MDLGPLAKNLLSLYNVHMSCNCGDYLLVCKSEEGYYRFQVYTPNHALLQTTSRKSHLWSLIVPLVLGIILAIAAISTHLVHANAIASITCGTLGGILILATLLRCTQCAVGTLSSAHRTA